MTVKDQPMPNEVSLTQLTLLGVAAVGGLAAGTSLGVRRLLNNGQARIALLLGYSIIGLASGVILVALGVFVPLLDVETLRGALVMGASGGGIGVLMLIGANIGSTMTLRYMGMRLTIEPEADYQRHRRRDDEEGQCDHVHRRGGGREEQ